MHIWIILLVISAAIVFGLDFLIRRKKWKDNSKAEKVSLVVHMCSVAPYVFLSALGLLWGIAANSPKTAFGQGLYDATLFLAGIYFIVALAAIILSFIFRKKEKAKASIWVNVIALLYIIVVFVVNSLAGSLL